MKQDKTKLVAYDKGGNIIFTAVVNINIFTYNILEQVYYTHVSRGVCAFHVVHLNNIMDIITTDPYYQGCRGCEHFKQCITYTNNNECKRGLIGGVFNC